MDTTILFPDQPCTQAQFTRVAGNHAPDVSLLLLLRQRDRKLAIAHARGEAFDELRYRVFAIGSDQLGERRKQAGLRQAIAIDAIVPCFRPGLVEITQRRLLLFVIGQRVAVGGECHWMAHETLRIVCAIQGGAPQVPKV